MMTLPPVVVAVAGNVLQVEKDEVNDTVEQTEMDVKSAAKII